MLASLMAFGSVPLMMAAAWLGDADDSALGMVDAVVALADEDAVADAAVAGDREGLTAFVGGAAETVADAA